jgi:hypothetical protein
MLFAFGDWEATLYLVRRQHVAVRPGCLGDVDLDQDAAEPLADLLVGALHLHGQIQPATALAESRRLSA